jgi:hypothetical protein
MTKKDLLEAIKDMPMDAEILVRDYDHWGSEVGDYPIENIECDTFHKRIVIC